MVFGFVWCQGGVGGKRKHIKYVDASMMCFAVFLTRFKIQMLLDCFIAYPLRSYRYTCPPDSSKSGVLSEDLAAMTGPSSGCRKRKLSSARVLTVSLVTTYLVFFPVGFSLVLTYGPTPKLPL